MATPSTSRVEDILDAVVAALTNIQGPTATYFTHVRGRVYRINSAAPTVTAYPTLEVFVTDNAPLSQVGYDSYQLYQAVLRLEVWSWVHNNTDPQGECSKIEQDVRTALEADQTLGGEATDVNWTGTRYTLADDKRGVGVAVIAFQIPYFVQRQDTSGGL